MNVVEKFEEWAIVEIMGHKRFAGRVTEQAVGGTSFVRIDIPEVTTDGGQTLQAFTKLFGAAAVYCISPCTEETARAFAKTIRAEGFSLYEAPRLPAPAATTFTSTPRDTVDELIGDFLSGDIADIREDETPFGHSLGSGPLRTSRVCNCRSFEVCDVCQNIASDPPKDAVPEEAGKRFLDPLTDEPF